MMPSPWDQFQRYNPPQAPAQAGAATGSEPLHGEDFLKSLGDPATAAAVKSVAEGRMAGTGRNLQGLMVMASQYNPEFQANQYPTMLATRKNYTSGKQFQESLALNTVSGHLLNLMNSADALDNSHFKPFNVLHNIYRENFDDPKLKKFQTDYGAVTNELAKAYHGGQVSDAAVRDWQDKFSAASGPTQMKAVIGELADLLHSKIQANDNGYRSSMGNAPMPSAYTAVTKPAHEAFEKIGNWSLGLKPEGAGTPPPGTSGSGPAPASGVPAMPTPAPAAAPKPGKYMYDPASGSMVPQ